MARETITLDEVLKIIGNLRGFINEINSACYNIDLIVKSQSTTNLYPIKHFLLHYSYLAFMNCCINCYKIYSEREKNSLPKLFNNLKNKKYDNKLNEFLKSNSDQNDYTINNKSEFIIVIEDILRRIETKKDLINKLNNRRLKYYAHTDTYSNIDSIIPPEKLSEIKELNEFTIKIFNYLNEKSQFDDHLFFTNITSIKKILEDCEFVDNYYKGFED